MRISTNEINPFDILSGKVVQLERGTFWFKEAGNNLDRCNDPIKDNLHRIGGPAIILHGYNEQWYINGRLHRDGGPAFICDNGEQYWFRHGLRHRLDGPAAIFPNGDEQWFIFGKQFFSEDEFNIEANYMKLNRL